MCRHWVSGHSALSDERHEGQAMPTRSRSAPSVGGVRCSTRSACSWICASLSGFSKVLEPRFCKGWAPRSENELSAVFHDSTLT